MPATTYVRACTPTHSGAARQVRKKLHVAENNVSILNIDIQAIEPVDQSTRDSLQKSVYMAIEITTKSQEAAARHEGQRNDQASRGRLERQRIVDEVEAERERMSLLQLQAGAPCSRCVQLPCAYD